MAGKSKPSAVRGSQRLVQSIAVASNAPLMSGMAFTQVPVEIALRGFRDTLQWLKTSSDESFTGEELSRVSRALDDAQGGNLESAVSALRSVHDAQQARLKRNLLRRIRNLAIPGSRTTTVGSLLSALLTSTAVERANAALSRFENDYKRCQTEDLMDKLGKMNPPLKAGDDFENDILSRFGGISSLAKDSDVAHALLAAIAQVNGRYYPSDGHCDVCRRPAIGEIHQTNHSVRKLCPCCILNARKVQGEANVLRGSLRSALKESEELLEEAHRLDSGNAHCAENLKTCRGIMVQLSN